MLALVCEQICLCLRVEGVHIDAWLQEHKFLDASVDPQLRKHNIVDATNQYFADFQHSGKPLRHQTIRDLTLSFLGVLQNICEA